MIYMRGQAADYDGWRQLGLAGWGWDDVLPYFLKHQDHAAPTGRFHQAGGEWRVEHPRMRWPILDVIQDALEAAGIPKVGVIAPLFVVAYAALLLVFGLSSGDRQLLTSFWASVRRPRLREARAT